MESISKKQNHSQKTVRSPVKILLLIFCFLLAGCSGTIPVNYNTQSYMKMDGGNASMGRFEYIPANEGKAKKNQLQNTAAGDVFIAEDVSSYVRRATAKELQNAGVQVRENSNNKIDATVHKFLLDDLGYSVTWSYAVTYRVENQSSGETIFERRYEPEKKKTGKFNQASAYTASVNKMILAALEEFMKDAKAKGLFEG